MGYLIKKTNILHLYTGIMTSLVPEAEIFLNWAN